MMLPDIVLYWLWSQLETMFEPGQLINESVTPNLFKLIMTYDNGPLGLASRSWDIK